MSAATMITFIISAPLLNPYIILLSFSVLGAKYAILRIASSFILAICTGLIVHFIVKNDNSAGKHDALCSGCNVNHNSNIYEATIKYFLKR